MAQVVGFIGLGIMGGRIARNVMKAGYALRAYNRTATKAEALLPLGATMVASPRCWRDRRGRWQAADPGPS